MNFLKKSGLFMALLLITILAISGVVMAREPEENNRQQGSQDEALSIALDYLQQNKTTLGLSDADLNDFVVQWQYTSPHNGVTHIFLRQRHAGIEVWNGNLQINVASDGSVLNLHNQFVSDLASKVNGVTPTLSATEAVEAAAQALGLTISEPLVVQESLGGAEQAAVLSNGGISQQAIPVKLMYQPGEKGEVRLAWDMEIEELGGVHWWTLRVDATTGAVLSQADRVADDSYRVYPWPIESPYYSVPPAPADGRILVVDPATAGSPFGWHDTNGAAGAEFTTTQGNNAHAYTDTNNDDSPDAGSSPDGGATLVFDFPIDLTQEPSAYRPAAVTNLFYWNNLIHDVFYEYGFDEDAGNFQENNYGNGGSGSDYVFAEAQDGGGSCNANMATPGDGSNPRMQMYICATAGSPANDGDLDNLVIVHEYGHGISNRLADPASTSCLFNAEQMGEGWSDYWGTWMTIEPGDTGPDPRAVGTYLFQQGAGGPGIRPAPYSTDFAINDYTYGDLPSQAVPHGVGFVWATMIWDMTWALVDEHGLNPDIYGDWTTGGNNLANQLVVDGLTLQPCNPGFVDGRDGILAADQALTGGDNACTIWEAFADRGLGFSASQGSSSSTGDGVEAFDLPPTCLTLDVTPTSHDICQGETAVYTVNVGPSYTASVTMSAFGNPAPTTATFNPNPVTPPGSTDLTIGNTAAAPAGNYTITIAGDDGTVTDTIDVELGIFAGAPGATTLVAPINGATAVPTQPTFEWTAVAGATDYYLEVATDPGFTNIVYTATESDTTHTATTALGPDDQHYWRVTTNNPCGTGTTSSVFTFRTAAILTVCSTPALPIPDDPDVSDTMTIASSGEIQDLNVSIDADHTWVGDLIFTLTHQDTGTSVTMIDRPGVPASTFGCSSNNIDVEMDDEGVDGPVESQCAADPALFGNPTPNNPLSAFDLEDTSGDWILSISDAAGGDTGTLNEWCVIATVPPSGGPSIDLEKTVSTDGSCGTLDALTVGYGTDVTYCYEVTNTGDITFTQHTLVDDQLGTILNNVSQELAPGASYAVTQTVAMTQTTTNTATWTATNGTDTAADSDSATVTVVVTPTIDVDPDSVSSTQAPDTTDTQTLTISNIGSGDLDWTITEDGGTIFGSHSEATPAFALPVVAGDSSTAAETVDNAVPTVSDNVAPVPAAPWSPSGGILYDNGPLVNSPGTGSGGADESMLQNTTLGMGVFGFGHQITAGNSVADDFTVVGDTWTVDSMVFYAYQTGSTTTTTLTGYDVTIYDGPPNAGGTVIVTSTTILDSQWANIYRVLETTSGNTDRPVMATTVDFGGLELAPGTYWVEWQAAGSLASGPWAPPITINGVITTGNGLQNLAGVWQDAIDVGQQGFPFLVMGTSGPGACSTDIPWVSVSPTAGTTPGGESDKVDVTFDSTGLATGVYTGTLCVDSNDPVTPRVTVPLTLTVIIPTYGVELSADQAQTGPVGTTVTYTLSVTNNGDVDDMIDLAVSGNTWVTDLSDASVSLDAGESVDVTVVVHIPADATDGETDAVTVTATSQGDPSETDTATLTTTAEVIVVEYLIYLPVIMKP